MANYSIEELENQGDLSVGLLAVAALGGLGALLLAGVSDSNNRDIDKQIKNLEIENNNLRSSPFGSLINASQIEANNRKIAELNNKKR